MPNNVDVVRRALDAFNSGDLKAMLAMQDPEFEWRPAFGGAMLGASVYRGPAAFREHWRDAQGIWDHTFRFDPETSATTATLSSWSGGAAGAREAAPSTSTSDSRCFLRFAGASLYLDKRLPTQMRR